MPILDGFSFSQSNSTSEITLAEMEDANGSSRRGRRALTMLLIQANGHFQRKTFTRRYWYR